MTPWARSRRFSPLGTSACCYVVRLMPQVPTCPPDVGSGNLAPRATLDWMVRSGRASMVGMPPTTKSRQEPDVLALARRVIEVSRMSTGELRAEVERLTGEPCRSWNKSYLQRKVTGLTQLGARHGETEAGDGLASDANAPLIPRFRDRRLPAAGSEIVKRYRGHDVRVRVLDAGFEAFGQQFDSLTAIAKVVTGQRFINGMLFFGLAKRSRKP